MSDNNLQQTSAATARHLWAAAQADAAGDHDAHHDCVQAAAESLRDLFVHHPHDLPKITRALRQASPAVLRSDLTAALDMVQFGYQQAGGDYAVVLHPDCGTWILEAAVSHGCTDEGDHATAWLCVTLDDTLKPTRPAGLPVPDSVQRLIGDSRAHDIEASLAVRERCARALKEESAAASELMALVRPAMIEQDATLIDAIDALAGPDRIRAEELFARYPSILTLPG